MHFPFEVNKLHKKDPVNCQYYHFYLRKNTRHVDLFLIKQMSFRICNLSRFYFPVFLKEMFDHTHIYTLYTSLFCINVDRGKFKDPVNGYYSAFIYEMKNYNLIQYKPFFRFDAKIKIHVWSNMAPKWKCWFYFDRHWLSRS